jgi:hypothetical protein
MKRIFIITGLNCIEITHDVHILRNLDWSDPRILVRDC